ncbi:MAG TPA: glycine--tRNA ligase subunit beta [Miltoncostaeaceae bacterium]|nr:glycine--tRNA ligase subunit beta [Miltoncostaeaceae bacterium]
MSDLLVEIGCEELPASACREALAQVPGLVADALAAARLPERTATVWVAPRRIAFVVPDLPATREGRRLEVRGPAARAAYGPDGVPTRAAEGFARAQGVAVEALELRGDGDRRHVVALRDEPAVPVTDLVPDLVRHVLEGIRFGKNMRWGDGEGLRFSRPVRWIVAKLGDATVPFALHGIDAGGTSRGHRFLGGPVEVPDAGGYRDALRTVGAVADQDERRREIVEGLDAAAAEEGCAWSDPGGKLEEVLYLVERPSVIRGDIDPSHLRLPERVLVTAMQSHQRYFPLRRPDGSLAARFLAVSNGDPRHADTIARGNAGVLDARLQDASFSWDRDREAGLDALDARLATIVFHARLGTMAHKRDRLAAGAARIAAAAGLDAATQADAERAGRLAKVDQGAVLVAEFSDLQGYVGAEYARLEGEPPPVCDAVRDQYLPEGPESPLPEGAAGACLALAEKIDNLTGAFLAGEVPTGSKDPYGLRRAAAGVVRILLDRGWDLSLRPLLEATADTLRSQGADLAGAAAPALDQLEAFVADRLAFQLAEEGVGAEAAAAAQGARVGGVVATARWARQIETARTTDAFQAAWTGCTRVVRISARAPEGDPVTAFHPAGDAGEDRLADAIAAARPGVESARAALDLPAALAAVRPLAEAVDRFFQDVLVNTDDVAARARRYALLRSAAEVLTGVADFTRVTDQGGSR